MLSSTVGPIMLIGIIRNVIMLIVMVPVSYLLKISLNILRFGASIIERLHDLCSYLHSLKPGTYPKPSVTKGMKLFLSGTYLTTENRFTEKKMIRLQMASHF